MTPPVSVCPECGEDFDVDPTRPGAVPTYCSRNCQVANYSRRRNGTTIRITVDAEARHLLDRAADRNVVSTRRYVELLVAEHVDALAAEAHRSAS